MDDELIADLVRCGLSHQQIAARLDVTKGQISGRVYRMRQRGVDLPPSQNRQSAPLRMCSQCGKLIRVYEVPHELP